MDTVSPDTHQSQLQDAASTEAETRAKNMFAGTVTRLCVNDAAAAVFLPVYCSMCPFGSNMEKRCACTVGTQR